MTVLLTLLTIVYSVAAILLALFSTGIFILLVLWFKHYKHTDTPPITDQTHWLSVTVQLPIYNEADVIHRLLNAVTALDYPRDRLQIQILDDSTDDTTRLIAEFVTTAQADGLHISHIRRADRTGYKAGALDYGLQITQSDLIAVFDADFVPEPDFLKRTVPYFGAQPELGILQTRWAHINAGQNIITRSQAMSIDGHFVVEQTARNRGGLLISFNGTGGIWRRQCIHDAGGWSSQTVAEDLDLSYRAQMSGWGFLYLPDVVVPAELPPQVAAYKLQQFRWAKGTTQNLLKLAPRVLRHRTLTPLQKFMGILHLCQYLPQPLLLILTLFTPILMVTGILSNLPLEPLGIFGLAAPIMYAISQRQLYGNWHMRLLAFPILLAIGIGVNFSNTVAIVEALTGRNNVFKRTPKFPKASWQRSIYALKPEWTLFVELGITIYLVGGTILAVRYLPGIIPFMLGQTYGYAVITGIGLLEWWHIAFNRQSHHSQTHPL